MPATKVSEGVPSASPLLNTSLACPHVAAIVIAHNMAYIMYRITVPMVSNHSMAALPQKCRIPTNAITTTAPTMYGIPVMSSNMLAAADPTTAITIIARIM